MSIAEKPDNLSGGLRDPAIPLLFSLVKTVDEARQDWISAKKLFEEATDKDLIDYAIHQIEAAERRYMYLLKKAREEGIWGEVSLR
ncbi:MAG: YaaL family protein [Bacillota bacterium]